MDEKTFNSLPLAQRKAIQQRLIDAGHYSGSPDGKWGNGTGSALKAEEKRRVDDQKAAEEREERKRQDDLREKELNIKERETSAKAGEIEAETARKKRYADDAASGLGLAASLASGVPALLGGTAAGMGLGKATSLAMDKAQESRNKVLQGVAADRVAGLTTREGAREAARLSGAVPMSNTAMRATSRMLPHMGLGALSIGKGVDLAMDQGGDSYYSDMLNRGAGYGLIGAGTGLVKRGIQYGAAPGVAPDAQALAVINSNQLRRNGPQGSLAQALTAGSPAPTPAQPQAPSPAPAAPKAPVQSQATKQQIYRDALGRFAKVPKGTGTAGLAAALAYGMTPKEAQAADGRTVGGTAEALTNAGIAGGAAYGTSKLAEALSPAIRGGIGMMGEASAPSLVDAMTEPTPDEMNTAANWQIENLPNWMLSPNVRQTAEMGQVPSPGDRSEEAMLARAQDEQRQRMPMAAASSLQIPEGIPAPQADGSSPYGQNIQGRVTRMLQLGATPEQVSAFLNQAVR